MVIHTRSLSQMLILLFLLPPEAAHPYHIHLTLTKVHMYDKPPKTHFSLYECCLYGSELVRASWEHDIDVVVFVAVVCCCFCRLAFLYELYSARRVREIHNRIHGCVWKNLHNPAACVLLSMYCGVLCSLSRFSIVLNFICLRTRRKFTMT